MKNAGRGKTERAGEGQDEGAREDRENKHGAPGVVLELLNLAVEPRIPYERVMSIASAECG